MLKKVLAILLSMAMLISATSVFAALPSAGTFTTTTAGTIDSGTSGRAVDDFNRHTTTAARFKGYVSKGTDVFYQHHTNYSTTGKVYTIDNLSDGNNAIGMTSDSSWTETGRLYMCLDTLAMKPADNYKAVFKYDLRFTNLSATKAFQSSFRLASVVPSSTPLAKVNDSYSPGIQLSRNSNNDGFMLQYPESISAGKIDVVQDKWYTVYTIVDNTGENSTIKCNTLIADRDTGEVLINYTFNRELTSGDFFFRAVRMAKINAEEIGTASIKLQVDNAELAYYNEAEYGPGLISKSIGEENVSVDTKSTTVVLDQPIKVSSSAASLTYGDSGVISCNITKDNTKINTYTVAWNDNLTGSTTYTLDLSELKNSANKAAGEGAKYSFTTENKQMNDITISIGDTVNVSGLNVNDTVSMTLNSAVAETATIIVGFYKQNGTDVNFVGMESIKDYSLVRGDNPVTVTLQNAYDADSIRLFVWKNLTTLKPLAINKEVPAR